MTRPCRIHSAKQTQEGELYTRTYGASLSVLKNVVPFLGKGDDMVARLSKSVKAVPRLVAAGLHGSVPQTRKEFSLGEAASRCRETVVMLSYCRDLHGRFVNSALCAELIELYKCAAAELGKIIDRPVSDAGDVK